MILILGMNARLANPRTAPALSFASTLTVPADDVPMFGRDNTRNQASSEQNPPTESDIRASKNIKWRALIGLLAWGDRLVKFKSILPCSR